MQENIIKLVTTSFLDQTNGRLQGKYKAMMHALWMVLTRGETNWMEQCEAAEQEYQQAREVTPAQPKNLLPAKYANPQTSGLKATVSPSGQNNFDFALTD